MNDENQDSQTDADAGEPLGLLRGTVTLAEHRPCWKVLYEETADALRSAIGDLVEDIQHVGSTAVPGLPAKPILDIALAVGPDPDIAEMARRLTELGYIYRGDAGDAGGHLFVAERAPEVRTVHIHVVPEGGRQWRNYLQLRDVLRQSPEIRAQYAEFKRHLAAKHPEDRGAYTAGKMRFIDPLLAEGQRKKEIS
mgnify:CR=1 FL=1